MKSCEKTWKGTDWLCKKKKEKKKKELGSLLPGKSLFSSLIEEVIYFDSYLIEFDFLQYKKSLLWALWESEGKKRQTEKRARRDKKKNEEEQFKKKKKRWQVKDSEINV